MFKFKLYSPRFLISMLEVISQYLDTVDLIVDKEGLKIKSMDGSKSILVDYSVDADIFSEFEVPKKEIIHLSLAHLIKILKRVKNSEDITFKYDDTITKFIVEVKDTHRFRAFEIPVIAVDEFMDPGNLGDLVYHYRMKVDFEFFEEMLKDAEMITEEVTFVASKNGMEFGGSSIHGVCHYGLGPNVIVSHTEGVEDEGVDISLMHLKPILKAKGTIETVLLEMTQDKPIRFLLGDDETGILIIYIAPLLSENYPEY